MQHTDVPIERLQIGEANISIPQSTRDSYVSAVVTEPKEQLIIDQDLISDKEEQLKVVTQVEYEISESMIEESKSEETADNVIETLTIEEIVPSEEETEEQKTVTEELELELVSQSPEEQYVSSVDVDKKIDISRSESTEVSFLIDHTSTKVTEVTLTHQDIESQDHVSTLEVRPKEPEFEPITMEFEVPVEEETVDQIVPEEEFSSTIEVQPQDVTEVDSSQTELAEVTLTVDSLKEITEVSSTTVDAISEDHISTLEVKPEEPEFEPITMEFELPVEEETVLFDQIVPGEEFSSSIEVQPQDVTEVDSSQTELAEVTLTVDSLKEVTEVTSTEVEAISEDHVSTLEVGPKEPEFEPITMEFEVPVEEETVDQIVPEEEFSSSIEVQPQDVTEVDSSQTELAEVTLTVDSLKEVTEVTSTTVEGISEDHVSTLEVIPKEPEFEPITMEFELPVDEETVLFDQRVPEEEFSSTIEVQPQEITEVDSSQTELTEVTLTVDSLKEVTEVSPTTVEAISEDHVSTLEVGPKEPEFEPITMEFEVPVEEETVDQIVPEEGFSSTIEVQPQDITEVDSSQTELAEVTLTVDSLKEVTEVTSTKVEAVSEDHVSTLEVGPKEPEFEPITMEFEVPVEEETVDQIVPEEEFSSTIEVQPQDVTEVDSSQTELAEVTLTVDSLKEVTEVSSTTVDAISEDHISTLEVGPEEPEFEPITMEFELSVDEETVLFDQIVPEEEFSSTIEVQPQEITEVDSSQTELTEVTLTVDSLKEVTEVSSTTVEAISEDHVSTLEVGPKEAEFEPITMEFEVPVEEETVDQIVPEEEFSSTIEVQPQDVTEVDSSQTELAEVTLTVDSLKEVTEVTSTEVEAISEDHVSTLEVGPKEAEFEPITMEFEVPVDEETVDQIVPEEEFSSSIEVQPQDVTEDDSTQTELAEVTLTVDSLKEVTEVSSTTVEGISEDHVSTFEVIPKEPEFEPITMEFEVPVEEETVDQIVPEEEFSSTIEVQPQEITEVDSSQTELAEVTLTVDSSKEVTEVTSTTVEAISEDIVSTLEVKPKEPEFEPITMEFEVPVEEEIVDQIVPEEEFSSSIEVQPQEITEVDSSQTELAEVTLTVDSLKKVTEVTSTEVEAISEDHVSTLEVGPKEPEFEPITMEFEVPVKEEIVDQIVPEEEFSSTIEVQPQDITEVDSSQTELAEVTLTVDSLKEVTEVSSTTVEGISEDHVSTFEVIPKEPEFEPITMEFELPVEEETVDQIVPEEEFSSSIEVQPQEITEVDSSQTELPEVTLTVDSLKEITEVTSTTVEGYSRRSCLDP